VGFVVGQSNVTSHISACPACGGTRIRAFQEDWSNTYAGKQQAVKNLRYVDCPQRSEKVYNPRAMRRIQAASPSLEKLPQGWKSA
jgi:hypothetical protein